VTAATGEVMQLATPVVLGPTLAERAVNQVPLRVIAEKLRVSLGLGSKGIDQLVDAACNILQVADDGRSVLLRAQECYTLVFGEQMRASKIRAPAQQTKDLFPFSTLLTAEQLSELNDDWAADIDGFKGRARVTRHLSLTGIDATHFLYHNFFGDWQLNTKQLVSNGRPHYVHNTLYGGQAHLFHIIDPNYHVPRWLIGPDAYMDGNSGWAFCETDAATPGEALNWTVWDGKEWRRMESLHFKPVVSEDSAMDQDAYDRELEVQAQHFTIFETEMVKSTHTTQAKSKPNTSNRKKSKQNPAPQKFNQGSNRQNNPSSSNRRNKPK